MSDNNCCRKIIGIILYYKVYNQIDRLKIKSIFVYDILYLISNIIYINAGLLHTAK